MAALLTHRRPEATLNPASGALEIHATTVREALALSIHHVPLVTTFAVFDCEATHGEPLVVIDPTVLEEKTCDGTMLVRVLTIVCHFVDLLTPCLSVQILMNAHKDVCGVQKAGGVGVLVQHVTSCIREAAAATQRLNAVLRTAVKKHDQERVASRVRRHGGTAGAAAPPAKPPPQRPAVPNVPETLRRVDRENPADGQIGKAYAPVDGAQVPDWDMVQVADAAFPFGGPLRVAVDGVQDCEDKGVGELRGDDAHGVPMAVGGDEAPASLLDAVKPNARKKGRR